jgi:hypothetical protein
MRLKSKRTVAIAAASLAVVGGAVGGAIAASQDDRAAEKEAFLADAAKRLDVTPQQLETALKEAAKARVDAAVAAGRITKEQGERMKEAIDAGRGGVVGAGRFGHRPGPGRGLHGFGFAAAAAKYLGITEAALRDELRGGKSLADVAKAKGKSVDGLKSAIVADAKSKLDQAVKDGKLTEAQAKEALDRLQSHVDDLVNRTPPDGPRPFGEGRHGGMRGMHGGMPFSGQRA